jgi:tetratricopeptide (TPR) repeat protein
VLEQKWSQVHEALRADDLAARSAVRQLLAYAALTRGDYRLATTHFSQLGGATEGAKLVEYTSALAQRHSKNAVAPMLKGDSPARRGQYGEALDALDEAVRLNPHATLVYDVRG